MSRLSPATRPFVPLLFLTGLALGACSSGSGGGDGDPAAGGPGGSNPVSGDLTIRVVEDFSFPFTNPLPIANATVRVVGSDGASAEGTTNANGEVGFSGLAAPLDVTAVRSEVGLFGSTTVDAVTAIDVTPTGGAITILLGLTPDSDDFDNPNSPLSGGLAFAPNSGSGYQVVAQTRATSGPEPQWLTSTGGPVFGAFGGYSFQVPPGEAIDLAAVQGDVPGGQDDVIAVERLVLSLDQGPFTAQGASGLDLDLGGGAAIPFDQQRTVSVTGLVSGQSTLEIAFNMTDPTTGSCFRWPLVRDETPDGSYVLQLPDPSNPAFGGYLPYLELDASTAIGATRVQSQLLLLELGQVTDGATLSLPEPVTVTAPGFGNPGQVEEGAQILIDGLDPQGSSGFVQLVVVDVDLVGLIPNVLLWEIYAPAGTNVLTIPELPSGLSSFDVDGGQLGGLVGGRFLWASTEVTYDDLFGPTPGTIYGQLVVTPERLRGGVDSYFAFDPGP